MSSANERSSANRRRAESFGAVAEIYDRVRPSYPAALIEELLADRPVDALDVGCGTGQVARLLAARGVDVLGIEVDERMAAVARAHGVPVEVGAFESWESAGRSFDLITCGQAWHWLDPGIAAARAADCLRPSGRLALFWNFITFDAATRAALDRAYAQSAPQVGRDSVLRGGGPATVATHVAEIAASHRYAPAEVVTVEWHQQYSREHWLALISSHSDHSTLPPGQLDALCAAIGTVIDARGGRLDGRYVTHAILARVS